MRKAIAIIILVIIIVFLYGKFIEVKNIKVNEYNLNSEYIKESFKELKIVHFSDILYNQDNKRLNKIEKLINNENADIIVFAGDLFNNNFKYSDEDYSNIKEFLTNINASLFKFAVIGENDTKFLEKYKDILYESNFTLLDNKNKLLFYKDEEPINIIGLTDLSKINELLESEVSYNYSLVITHKPDYVDELSKYDIDLVLSGHSLGGIINVPYYGGLITKDGAKKYVNGYYKVNNTELYISNGMGYQNFNFRLLNTPSINVYRFN